MVAYSYYGKKKVRYTTEYLAYSSLKSDIARAVFACGVRWSAWRADPATKKLVNKYLEGFSKKALWEALDSSDVSNPVFSVWISRHGGATIRMF